VVKVIFFEGSRKEERGRKRGGDYPAHTGEKKGERGRRRRLSMTLDFFERGEGEENSLERGEKKGGKNMGGALLLK